jgi:hypothetical protein
MTAQRIHVALLLALVVPAIAFGQAPPKVATQPTVPPKAKLSACDSFTKSVEQSLKYIDMVSVDDLTDNSAPRATVSNIKINSELLLISMNLQLARDNGCPARKDPIRTNAYLGSAMKCKTDRLAASLKGDKSSPAICDTDSWQAD